MYGCFVLCTGTGYRTAHTAYCQSLPDAPQIQPKVSVSKHHSPNQEPCSHFEELREWHPRELKALDFVVLEHLEGQPRKPFKSTVIEFQDRADNTEFRVPPRGANSHRALISEGLIAGAGLTHLEVP
eukprot:jgi/Chrzof1/2160/Cz11g04150.t1